jgi:hypothetical protein
VWDDRDTSSGGYNRNDQGERAATAKGLLAMKAATTEKVISIMARAGNQHLFPYVEDGGTVG